MLLLNKKKLSKKKKAEENGGEKVEVGEFNNIPEALDQTVKDITSDDVSEN
jgi:hypothetical protein